MTYPMSGQPGVYPPPGQPPWNPPPAPPPPPRRGTAARLGLAAAVVAAALGGGIIGSLLTHRSNTSDTSAATTAAQPATPEYVRAQDIKLCTEYALINVARPQPVSSSGDLLAAVAAVRTSLAAHPDASADIRLALDDIVATYFATMSNRENRGAKGLVEPPKYDQAAAQAAYDRAWAICGLK